MRARAFAFALVFPFWGLGAGCNQTPLDVATIAPTNLANGLVAHWTFDETAGATAHDSSGNGRDGSVFGPGWSWTTGHFAGALQLSGNDQHHQRRHRYFFDGRVCHQHHDPTGEYLHAGGNGRYLRLQRRRHGAAQRLRAQHTVGRVALQRHRKLAVRGH